MSFGVQTGVNVTFFPDKAVIVSDSWNSPVSSPLAIKLLTSYPGREYLTYVVILFAPCVVLIIHGLFLTNPTFIEEQLHVIVIGSLCRRYLLMSVPLPE